MTLAAADFATFFSEVHGHPPFPWQERLLRQVAERGEWPQGLNLPTGSGKTAAIDIAVFHLALEADTGERRRAPLRIAFVVDRRLVVDDAFERAEKLAKALRDPQGRVTPVVAERLRLLSRDKIVSDDAPPLLARRLRGGIPREDDWARTPAQPTILCSTVDQVGSRLLFRGYGISDAMKPVHAGLIGSDCLILLDEAHLAEPFRQTLEWVRTYQGPRWCEVQSTAPRGFVLLTATPGEDSQSDFSLGREDREDAILRRRLSAAKPARLIAPAKRKGKTGEAESAEESSDAETDLSERSLAILAEVRNALIHFAAAENNAPAPAIAIVVNRVARARRLASLLKSTFGEEIASARLSEPILMIGPARPFDREELAKNLEPIRTRIAKPGDPRQLDKPVLLVATQCIEAGVDIDLDGLITEAAPIDALRQRFGRLNRAGRDIHPYAAVLAGPSDMATRAEDPVYGKTIRAAWDHLNQIADVGNRIAFVDFGVDALEKRLCRDPAPAEAMSTKQEAPILLPAHVDLLSQTAPVPSADPEVALYLHGAGRQMDSVTVVWRGDIDPKYQNDEDVRRLLTMIPPRAGEAIQLPLWTVRRWLVEGKRTDALADVVAAAPEEDDAAPAKRAARHVFLWCGDQDASRWVSPRSLRPGQTIVVPAVYGGADQCGWNPESEQDVVDIGERVALPFAGRRFAVRIAPGLFRDAVSDEHIAATLAAVGSRQWRDVRDALSSLPLPEEVQDNLEQLDAARKGRVICYTDLHGSDDQGLPRGAVFLAPLGLDRQQTDEGQANSTEDDSAGSLPGFALSLDQHSRDVEHTAETFARLAGLPAPLVADLKLAGWFHDQGKADARFQAWLHYGDPFGPDPDHVLAKSARRLPRKARAASQLPDNWRHEALSVRKAVRHERLKGANDPELVLFLVGSHHGYGRPLFPHCDATEAAPDVGPQAFSFEWRGRDWACLFERLKTRYGAWELARMEAILRLADHRASEMRAREENTR
ncbi:MAG TPA: type I-U CRISPR-associated helicase/endonuclease Cas3 [Terriglobales bacterium]|nr:type I-U CRISPR-associated helicase/endonuclease Cas3 [Terriglobales bacterium]